MPLKRSKSVLSDLGPGPLRGNDESALPYGAVKSGDGRMPKEGLGETEGEDE